MSTAQFEFDPTNHIDYKTAHMINDIKKDLFLYNMNVNKFDQKIDNLEKVLKEESNKIWKKLEFLDQRINDNFKYLTGIMLTLFSGLYATALGGMLFRLCKWI